MQEIVSMPVGENIRQMRRQQSLTQSELGGDRFSKSYVSAVERNKIVPSYEALHFFAEQLGQKSDFFEKIFLQNENAKYTTIVASEVQNYNVDEAALEKSVLPLLDSLLSATELSTLPLLSGFAAMAPTNTNLSVDMQGRYAFLIGLIAQQQQNYSMAIRSLETALTLGPNKYRPAILDAIGTNYYFQHAYYSALDYHKRALKSLQSLEEQEENEVDMLEKISTLRLKIEFNCASDYHALGAHHQAREHFEHARQRLSSTHDIRTASQLYLKLGYCTYAEVYHNTALKPLTTTLTEEIEREFQRAVGYFVQSRTLYQVSRDRFGEARVRIAQAMVLLDLASHQRQSAEAKGRLHGKMPIINCASLLGEAEEQCRQVLLAWEADTDYPAAEIETLIYTALAYLVRVATQRSMVARLNNYSDTAIRESSIAASLCQRVLDTLVEPTFPWTLVQHVAATKERVFTTFAQSVPHVPETALNTHSSLRQDASHSIVLFVAGEVAELLGDAATHIEYAQTCYDSADYNIHVALDIYSQVFKTEEHDLSYLYRSYLRCIEMLEERKQMRPEIEKKTNHTLLHLLKNAIQTSHIPVL